MDDIPAIIGLSEARTADRLIALLNVLRLQELFGVSGRLIWPVAEGLDATDEAALHPRDLFDQEFVDRYLLLGPAVSELRDGDDLAALASDSPAADIAARLAGGGRLVVDRPADAVVFAGEDEADVRGQIGRIAAMLPFHPKIGAYLARLSAAIDGWGGSDPGEAAALCLHGDHLPDEISALWAARQPGAVLVFAANVAAGAHVACDDPAMLPIQRLAPIDNIPPRLRPLIEILLMARFARIGGGETSAAARAAALIGQRRFCPLPRYIPEPARSAAGDVLLERLVARPDSFFDRADLAQSAEYLVARPLSAADAARLVTALTALGAQDVGLRPLVGRCALMSGQDQLAARHARSGLADPGLGTEARTQCAQILTLTTASRDPDDPAATDAMLALLFDAQGSRDHAWDLIVQSRLAGLPRMASALLIPASTAAPVWSILADWEELIAEPDASARLREVPALSQKLAQAGPEAGAIEAALQVGDAPASNAEDRLLLSVGLVASALSLHGRFARALRVLDWLDRQRPDDPLTLKRRADACFRLGNRQRGHEVLGDLTRRCPGTPLLHLSAAIRAAGSGRMDEAAAALTRAEQQWPASRLIASRSLPLRRLITGS